MNKRIIYLLSLFFLMMNIPLFGQIDSDTLLFKGYKIQVFKYILEDDTITRAYFDQNIPRVMEIQKTNIGLINWDMTADSIVDYVFSLYQYSSVYGTELSAPIINFQLNQTPTTNSAKTRDSYWIGSINYYSKQIKADSINYLNYFELANSLIEFHGYISPTINDRIIAYLHKCISLNPNFLEAYMIKAKVHEENGILKGSLVSDPCAHIVDLSEIRLAIEALDNLLQLMPQNEEAEKYKTELNNKYFYK